MDVLLETLYSALLKCEIIENIVISCSNSYCKKYYSKIYDCNLIINVSEKVLISICIPYNWAQELIDIYIKDYNQLCFMPHIEKSGKICLFDKEGVLIDQDLIGITNQSIYRAKDILENGLSKKNQLDFINEFESYWAELTNGRLANFLVPNKHQNTKIKVAISDTKRGNKEKFADYIRRIKKSIIYIAETENKLERWNINNKQVFNGYYFVVSSELFIYPPDIRITLNVNYLNDLLKMVSNDSFIKTIVNLKKENVFVFEIEQPNGTINYIGFYFENGKLIDKDGIFKLEDIDVLQPINICRADKKYLLTRTIEKEINKDMKILVIGCGSIGGYLINELAKQGYENLTIMDNDILCEENIFRHVLGLEYIAKNKAEALKEFIRKNIPEMYINSKNEKIQDYLYDDENDLNDFDLIISTVGNHNVNRWLNSYIYAKKVLTPVIYAWNEVYGIGNHVAFIKYQNIGCYNCFFGRDEDTDELYDKTSYCKPGQMIARHVYGCDHSFIPYGNSVSLKTVLVCIDVINEFNENNNMENFIISIKGNDRYFREQGLEATTKYKNQNELVKKITGDLFINKGCGVCKNDNI